MTTINKPDHTATVAQLRARIGRLEAELAAERTCPITGLPTRRSWTRLAAREFHADAVVLLADLDGFKQVNDTAGHAAGDLVLATIADRLRGCLDGAVWGRLGGDEFAGVLDGELMPGDLDRVVAELAAPIATTTTATIDLPGAPIPSELEIGISLGVSEPIHRGDCSLAVALAQADRAMYEAKQDPDPSWETYQPDRHSPAALADRPLHRTRYRGFHGAA